MKESARKWLLQVPGDKKWYIVGLLLAQAVLGGSSVLYALFLRGIVDAAVAKNAQGFWHNIMLTALLAAGQLLLRALIRWLTEFSKSSFENVFKGRLARTLFEKDYLLVSAVHSGEWMNRLTSDTVVVADGYVEILPGIVGMAVKLIGALAMVIALEPRFAVILIPGGAVLAILALLFRTVMKRLHKNVQTADGRLRIFLQERITSLFMLRSFAAEAQTETDADEKMRAHRKARMRRNHFSNLCNFGFGAAMTAMYLLGVGWCGYGILLGTVTFGTLTAVMQLIAQIQSPIVNITGYLPKYYAMLASAERLMEAEAFDAGEGEAFPLSDALALYEDELAAFGLRDVGFAYYPVTESVSNPEKTDLPVVLHHLSIEIQKGEFTAFTGASGCGKTTVLKLLTCVMRPDEGQRYWIDIHGKTRELTGADRRLFAYVPQGNYLMSGTIREIVSFAEPSASQDEQRLLRALRIACADAFVNALDHGVDTLLGERGAGLSEGQMQRIAIARAIFSDSPILLLDEATSALDTETEKQLLENLRAMTDKTVVIVTHRPAALSVCDRVLEFSENGVQTVLSL